MKTDIEVLRTPSPLPPLTSCRSNSYFKKVLLWEPILWYPLIKNQIPDYGKDDDQPISATGLVTKMKTGTAPMFAILTSILGIWENRALQVGLVISFQLIVWWWHYVLLKYKHFITFNFVCNSIAILITAVFLTETTMVFIRKQKKEKKGLCLTFWHKTTAQLSRSQGNTIPSNLQIQVTSFKIPLALLFKEL